MTKERYIVDERPDMMKIKLLDNAVMPKQMRDGDAGYDFYLTEDIKIKPRQQLVIDTKIAVEIPSHYAGLFALRGSTCLNQKHLILKNPLADSNFRGTLHLILYNDGFFKSIKYKKGDRIASLFVFNIYDRPLQPVEELSETNRGTAWNGSSNNLQ